jgi:hypothetical protein
MLSSPDLEIRTRSVPTAGHLLALGFEPLGVVTHPSGSKTFRFSPDAREALERFLLAKQKLDSMLADAAEGRGERGLGHVGQEAHGRSSERHDARRGRAGGQ